MSELRIQTMGREDLDLAIEWAAREGWNPGLGDADPFFAADPNGFFMGFLDGTPVSCVSAVAYGERFGFVGFYIVVPEARGRGLGLATWNHALAYLGDRSIGLDGVVAQQETYRRGGFELAYRNIRFEGPGLEDPPTGLTDPEDLDPTEVVRYLRGTYPAPRNGFHKLWWTQPGAVRVAVWRDGQIRGLGLMRRCRVGWKIGPLVADDPDIADRLFRGLACRAGQGPVYLDVPEPNEVGLALASRYGMTPAFETARMYRGPMPDTDLSRLFGVTTFELG
ncbi:MAG: GNAT family N-acetyltransferase [Fimbriimonadaceae bacterium]|nr:GNAT family N-acetyltransferase [Fimbriimonadaceae bacterium]